jgi:UDP-N-acetylglucosamine 2-epimerase (non-hydrolysing)
VNIQHGRLKIASVLGTRPEIIKCSTLIPRFDADFEHTLIHTGQHYDANMDSSFFEELGLRPPDHALGVGSGSQADQLARMLVGIEPLLAAFEPDWVVVQGDTNSTLAGALAASKLGHKVAHVEAGCRSFNRAMPEEINRVLVDHLSTLCLATDAIGVANLASEGINGNKVQLVGSTGVDACLRMADRLDTSARDAREIGSDDGFLVVTIHRAENTEPAKLAGLMSAIGELSRTWPVVFPVHPRTANVLRCISTPDSVRRIEPVGYRQMIGLLKRCTALLTDSGGLQEEAAVVGTPTFILRNETEWIDLVERGHHRLVGIEPTAIVKAVSAALLDAGQLALMREAVGRERAGASDRIVDALKIRDPRQACGWKEEHTH